MIVTNVSVLLVDNDPRLRAYVTIKLNDCLLIKNMKVIDGTAGLFVAMPSQKMKDGKYQDVVNPTNKPTREMIEQAVFDAYNKALSNKDSERILSKI